MARQEVLEEEEEDGDDDNDTYVNFSPDIEPDAPNKEGPVTLEDPRLARGEEIYQLRIEQEIDDIGTY